MKRRKDEPELVGAYEAAEILSVKQSNLRIVEGLPEPYQDLKRGVIWRADEIRTLAAEIKAGRRKFKAWTQREKAAV